MPAGLSHGNCDARFVAVREAFEDNFTQRGELGGAVCVSVEGRFVVDLWGGWRDHTRSAPWAEDTLVNVFSVGKGLTALCVARLVGAGRLDVDWPVARVWPEFAAAGKEDVTIRQLLSHQAGLPAVREPLPAGTAFDWAAMTDALARQAPWWPPGSAHGYHVNTFGYLVGEVVRRVAGRSIGALLRDEIAAPLGADVHIGLARREHGRVAQFWFPADGVVSPTDELRATLDDRQLMQLHTYANPPEASGAGVVNTPEWRMAEIPSTNGHATARGIARVYAALAAGGTIDGVEAVGADALAAAVAEQVSGEDRVLGRPSRFGLGFQLTQPERPLGPNPGAFGHFGAGGSLGFCDPAAGIAFGYVMNEMGPRWRNPRNAALIAAVFGSL